MSRRAIVVVAVLVALGAGVLTWYRHVTAVKTIYARGFSKERLVELRYGASMAEVRRSLGNPLAVVTTEQPEIWLYGKADGGGEVVAERRGVNESGIIPLAGPPSVFFDSTNHVTKITGDVSRFVGDRSMKGSSKEIVERTFGRPLVVRRQTKTTEFRYSEAACSDCNYEEVRLWFDEGGRLIEKRARVMWD
jgi:hypothetical protein